MRLPAGAVWSKDAVDRMELLCETGAVWITRSADPRDYRLAAGERMCLPDGGRVVVQSLDDAAVLVRVLRRK